MDDFSDGMCCGSSGDGYYKLVLDDVVIERGDKVFEEEMAIFGVDPKNAAFPTHNPTKAPIESPSKAPSESPTKAPTLVDETTDAPTKKPTPPLNGSSCIQCTDEETSWMVNNEKDCITSYLIHTKCNKDPTWTENQYCRQSCYDSGFEYSGDFCCDTPLNPTQKPTSSPNGSSCIQCTYEETPWMARKGKDCTSSDLIQTKCNKDPIWTENQYCRKSCYNAGFGYSGSFCCNTSCIECSDAETTWMKKSKDCTTSDLINTKCNLSNKLSTKSFVS